MNHELSSVTAMMVLSRMMMVSLVRSDSVPRRFFLRSDIMGASPFDAVGKFKQLGADEQIGLLGLLEIDVEADQISQFDELDHAALVGKAFNITDGQRGLFVQ